MSPSLARNRIGGRGLEGACCVMDSPWFLRGAGSIERTETWSVRGSCAAWHFHGLHRLIRFRFDSVPVWPEAGEEGQRNEHFPAEARERESVGKKAAVDPNPEGHAPR